MSDSFNTALHTAALECALRRKRHQCKCQWDTITCNSCRLYIKNYIDAEPSKVQLYMFQIEVEADMFQKQSKAHHPIFAAVVVICLLLSLFYYKKVDYFEEDIQPPAKTMTTDDKIWTTLTKVSNDLNRKKDVNGDGFINCIDAAVLFYQYYPDECFITWNHKSESFNHLFNTILYDGVWRCIEPQTVWKNYAGPFMLDVWGKQYDSSYNEPATEKYKKYAVKK